jgi:Flp pilus assembly protein TadB
MLASGGERAGKVSLKDSRNLARATRVMDTGARFIRIEQSYWDKLDRKLTMMGESAGGKETITLMLLRSMLVALPIIAVPLMWEGWWKAGFYPLAVAIVFREESKALNHRYDQWQKTLERDIPEVIDRVRICFAGGRDYLSALRQAQASSGPAMSGALNRLIHDIQATGASGAFRMFSNSFDLPALHKLASSLMLAVESGYEAAEAYFRSIEGELTALREEATQTLLQTKPERVYRLYAMLFALAVAALALKGWEILAQAGKMFG